MIWDEDGRWVFGIRIRRHLLLLCVARPRRLGIIRGTVILLVYVRRGLATVSADVNPPTTGMEGVLVAMHSRGLACDDSVQARGRV